MLIGVFIEVANKSFQVIKRELDLDLAIQDNDFVYNIDKAILAGEDFGFFSDKIPACYVSIGAGNFAPQHNPRFNIDEKVFKVTLNLLSALAIEYLS